MTDFAEEFDAVMREAWKPPPTLTVSEWADTYRQLSPEASSEPGQWHTSRAPYLKAIMDAYSDPYWKEIVGMLASQTAKTEVINNVLGFNVHLNPAPMLLVQPTLDMAEAWSKDRLAPMIRDTAPLSDRIKTKSRESGNTLLHKSFSGGHITAAGANSPASLASRPVRDVFADEIDRFPPSAGHEGDPLNLAIQRTANFWNSKVIMTSTPTIKGASRIEEAYSKSQQHEYFVPCPECKEMQTLNWKQVVIPQDSKGEYETNKTFYACVNGCIIKDKSKAMMLHKGEWRLVKKGALTRRIGFFINAIYSPWVRWSELADSFLEAKDEPDLLQTFINTKLAETWELRFSGGLELLAAEECENYDKDSLPEDILVVTAAVDTQDDRLELLSQGWGRKRERWNIEHVIFWGDTSRQAVWLELDAHLRQTKYKVGDKKLSIVRTIIDSGGHRTQEVYDFCKPRQTRGVFAGKGSSSYYAPIANRGKQVGKQRITLYEFGSDTAKDSILYSSLRLEKPGPGYIHHAKWCDQEYFDQLSMSEVKFKNKPTDRLGRKRKITRLFQYQQLRERNEILDLHVMNLVAYYVLNPNIDAIIAKNSRPAEVEPPSQKPLNTKKRLRKSVKRKNWATDI